MSIKRKKIVIAVGKDDIAEEEVCDILRCKRSVEDAVSSLGFIPEIFYVSSEDFKKPEAIASKVAAAKPFCVFNLFEGFSSDSSKEVEFVKILESAKLPFTGNGSLTLGACLNKVKTKEILKKHGLPAPEGILIKNTKKLECAGLKFPIFLKPCMEDASLGIDKKSLVNNTKMFYRAVKEKLEQFPRGIIAEEFIPGKEYCAGLIGPKRCQLLGVSIIDYAKHKDMPRFLTYNSKWGRNTREFKKLIPSLSGKDAGKLKKEAVAIAISAGKALGCSGYFRVDLREKNGRLFILDINPNPDISEDSGFVKQAAFSGYSFKQLIKKIIDLGKERF